VIVVKTGQHSLEMQSWHELYEAGGITVATSGGLQALEGRTLDTVLKQEPEDYQRYRQTWSSLRKQITDLIPQKGTPTKGHVKMLAGIITWIEP
jgi:hypothetical protein